MAPLDAPALAFDGAAAAAALAARLEARYGDRDAGAVIALAVGELFPGRIALVSSFGAESAVLLHLLSRVDRSVPVIFLDTGRLFAETLAYRRRLGRRLGLSDVRAVRPDPAKLAASDPNGTLSVTDPDVCCFIRKAEPLERALTGLDAWITGRKRFQNRARATMPVFEAEGDRRVKINPLARWTADDLAAYAARHDLPAHPLVARGYRSIGCVPCTTRVRPGEEARVGRWRGLAKTECGIHAGLASDGGGI